MTESNKICKQPLMVLAPVIAIVDSCHHSRYLNTVKVINSADLIHRLEAYARVIHSLLDRISSPQIHWKPSPNSWSIIEVAAHLLDEEREDFRVRLDILLNGSGADFPLIDPGGWATKRGYAKRDLEETRQAFQRERECSISRLHSLKNPAWENARDRPGGGYLSAGDVLASWVAHDLLHIRQLTRLHWQYIQHSARPYSVEYAGEW